MKPPALLLSALCALSAMAAEKIEGAFGLKLGTEFLFPLAKGDPAASGERTIYQGFEPAKRNSVFTNYFVLMTPKTKKIYCIGATGPSPGERDCSRYMELISEKLAEKYGTKVLSHRSLPGQKIISGDEGSSITIQCAGDVIEIRYVDLALRDQAYKEKLEEDVANLDMSGL